MAQILIFGGTTEGRTEALRLRESGEDISVSVTSEYARMLLPGDIDCHVGIMEYDEMLAYIAALSPKLVIDAAHPFAQNAHLNIKTCCRRLNIEYRRIERPSEAHMWRDDVWSFKDADSCASALKSTEGNILLTTGSHTVGKYTSAVPAERIWVRVLPTHEALKLCEDAGIIPSRIIAMHGPFSADLNAAMYDQLNIKVMVTKDSGASGGVDEKVLPALARQIQVLMIERPKDV